MIEDSRFMHAFYYTMKNEGAYSDYSNDPGGATKFGISLAYLRSHVSRGTINADINNDGIIDARDVRSITLKQAQAFYKKDFWRICRGIEDEQVAIKLFDSAVNLGCSQAVKLIQRIVGVTDDGVMGKNTLAGINAMRPNALLYAYVKALTDFYNKLTQKDKSLNMFLKGWLNRAKRIPNKPF